MGWRNGAASADPRWSRYAQSAPTTAMAAPSAAYSCAERLRAKRQVVVAAAGWTATRRSYPAAARVPKGSRPVQTEHLFVRRSRARLDANGYRRARRPRRPRAQPEGHHGPVAAEQADLHHGALRLREVVARLRHDLRGGAAPLRRVALGVCAPVPPDDGEARRRPHRRALAGDLDRPEDHVPQSPLHRRHRDGDLRLPAPPLRARWPAALPDLRAAHRGA